MEFYRSVFGGEFDSVQTFGEMPQDENFTVPDEEQNRLMHISLPLQGGQHLMASDTSPSMGHKLIVGNNNYISLHPDSVEEAERLFDGLSEGGNIEMPLEKQFWGDHFGSFKDKFGVGWMVNYHPSE
jgi:PhnB protein